MPYSGTFMQIAVFLDLSKKIHYETLFALLSLSDVLKLEGYSLIVRPFFNMLPSPLDQIGSLSYSPNGANLFCVENFCLDSREYGRFDSKRKFQRPGSSF